MLRSPRSAPKLQPKAKAGCGGRRRASCRRSRCPPAPAVKLAGRSDSEFGARQVTPEHDRPDLRPPQALAAGLCARPRCSRSLRRSSPSFPSCIVFPLLFAITTVLERKGLGRIQNRYGPNRVGPFGFLQPMADGIKSLTKEDIVPRTADQVVHFLAPLLLVVAVVPGLRRAAHRPQHGRRQSQRRRAVLLRRRLHGRARRLHGRLVEPQQVFAARRHARHRADDQLRDAAGARVRRRHHGRRLALHRRHRRTCRPATPASGRTGSSSRPGDSPASSSS